MNSSLRILTSAAKGPRATRWLFAFVIVCSTISFADPSLPHLFSDHMVVQHGREIRVWGTADPKEDIAVTLAGNTRTVAADSAGRWSVQLPSMPPGGPFLLKVAGKKTILIKDVMVGEVWIASGQSNMTFALSGSVGAEQELPTADYTNIRLFTVPRRTVSQPQADTQPASWQLCTPDNAKEFSAVAYYFARDLHRKLQVPVGIIESAWPGTAIEEWVPPAAADHDARLKPMLQYWNRSQGGHFDDSRQPFDLQFDDFELIPGPDSSATALTVANFEDGSARTTLGGDWSYNWRDASETTFEIVSPGRAGSGFAAHLAGAVDAADDSRVTVHYHADGSPVDVSSYAGIRFWARGNGMFRFRSLQPAITDWDDYSIAAIKASPEWTQVTIWFRDLRQDGWGVVNDFTPSAVSGFSIEAMPASGYPDRPASGLYNGMIAPLVKYPFRGAIWYQGESNGQRGPEYRVLLKDMIEGWRTASNQPDMQFGIVQLPNHGAIPTQPGESGWAEVRESELKTSQELPGVGLAVTIDVGDPKDLHPHRKAEVGQRLALWALGATYKQPIVYSGPIYKSMEVEQNKIRIRFTDIGAGLEARGGDLRGFAIAGADRKFYWASAVIDGDSVIVSSPQVSSPVAARYAWGDSPECNLFNRDGLPASPFRTDTWPTPVWK